jgi:hypothetical protein
MGLSDAVNEALWKSNGGGQDTGSYSSTFVRRIRFDPAATYPAGTEIVEDSDGTKYVYTRKVGTTTYKEIWSDLKHYGLTEAACTNYAAANPTLTLSWSRQNEFGKGFTLSKRTASRELLSYVLSDAPTGS